MAVTADISLSSQATADAAATTLTAGIMASPAALTAALTTQFVLDGVSASLAAVAGITVGPSAAWPPPPAPPAGTTTGTHSGCWGVVNMGVGTATDPAGNPLFWSGDDPTWPAAFCHSNYLMDFCLRKSDDPSLSLTTLTIGAVHLTAGRAENTHSSYKNYNGVGGGIRVGHRPDMQLTIRVVAHFARATCAPRPQICAYRVPGVLHVWYARLLPTCAQAFNARLVLRGTRITDCHALDSSSNTPSSVMYAGAGGAIWASESTVTIRAYRGRRAEISGCTARDVDSYGMGGGVAFRPQGCASLHRTAPA